MIDSENADLAKLLYEQQAAPMNMVWISYYWQQVRRAELCTTFTC